MNFKWNWETFFCLNIRWELTVGLKSVFKRTNPDREFMKLFWINVCLDAVTLSPRNSRKPTRLLTNSCCGAHLAKRCNGKHDHQRIEGQARAGGYWINRSACPPIYPESLVLTIVKLVEVEYNETRFLLRFMRVKC